MMNFSRAMPYVYGLVGALAVIVVAVLLSLAGVVVANAQTLPGAAQRLLPDLQREIVTYWPELRQRAFPAALIEQESGWRVNATLRTSRELGVGLGQFTRATNRDGSVRFDALSEMRSSSPDLRGWSWRDPYNTHYQLRAVVLKLRDSDRLCANLMADEIQSLACDAATYNGGAGSVSRRIHLCRIEPGCNPRVWFGHLDHQVAQSTRRVAGYGESFAEINSRYPARVFARMPKYAGRL